MSAIALLAACGSPATVTTAPTVSPAPTRPVPSMAATVAPSSGPTLPPGVSLIEDGRIAPGAYWFQGFEPWLEIEIPGPGWEVGHFHDEIFDLFLEGDFPAIAFARFPTVATPASSADPAGGETSAASIEVVLDALRSNPAVMIHDVGPVEIGGLTGTTVDIRVTDPQTALFGAGIEGFHFDPGFEGRFHLLEVAGGVVEIFVTHREGHIEEAIEATQAILDSVRVVNPG
jgi:hypothetical protein